MTPLRPRKLPSPYRKTLALLAALTVSCVSAPASAATGSASVEVNGTFRGRIVVVSTPECPFLPLAQIARLAGKRAAQHAGRVELEQNRSARVSAGSTIAYSGTEEAFHLRGVPFLERGNVYVCADDAAQLLDADIEADPKEVHVFNAASAVAVITDRATPVPQATPHTSEQRWSERAAAISTHQSIIVRMGVAYGGTAERMFGVEANTGGVYGRYDAGSYDNAPMWSTGTLRFGSETRNVALGDERDVSPGLLFAARRTSGVALENEATRILLGRQAQGPIYGATFGSSNHSTTLAFVHANQGGEIVFGDTETMTMKHLVLTREVTSSVRGFGGAVYAATTGRVFGEALVSGVTQGMPVDVGDVPVRLNGGIRLSEPVTIRAGMTRAWGTRTVPYGSIDVHIRNLSVLAATSASQRTLAVNAIGPGSFADVALSEFSGARQWQADAGVTLPHGMLQFSGWNTGASDTRMIWRSSQGPALLLGYEKISSGAVRAQGFLAGLSLQVNRDLWVDVTTQPVSNGQHVRVEIAKRITPAPRRAPRTTIFVDRDAYVFIDGEKAGAASSGRPLQVTLPTGLHSVRAAIQDGSYGSDPADVVSGAAQVSLHLFPVRPLHGRVIIGESAGKSSVALDGIAIQLSNGAQALSDARGYFMFPAQAVGPGTTVRVVPETIPAGFAAVVNGIAQDGIINITLSSSAPVEMKQFP